MRIAVVGSRDLFPDDEMLEKYLFDATELVSGGARGVDACAAAYARRRGILLTVFLPQYERFGRAATHVRNREITDYADRVVAFWDGKSRGTHEVIRYAEKQGKPLQIVHIPAEK